MSKINLFFDTIVYLYRCVAKILLFNYHELSFYINSSLRVVDELNKFILDIRSFGLIINQAAAIPAYFSFRFYQFCTIRAFFHPLRHRLLFDLLIVGFNQ